MKLLLLDYVLRGAEHKYILLAAGALGIAYYVGSHVLSPDSPKIYPEEIQTIMTRANNHLFNKQYQQAAELYSQIIAYDEHCAAAYFNKGQSLFHLERWREACTHYEKALASGMRPEHLHLVHFNYSLALFQLNDVEKTIEQATKSLSYQPIAPAYVQRALAYELLEQFDNAYADLKKACALAFEPQYAQALVKVGNGFRDQEDFEKAAQCYRDAIHYVPQDSNTYQSLGDVLHLHSKKTNNPHLFDEALTLYQKVVELNPMCYLAYHNLACMMHEKGDEVQSIAYMNKTFACAPDHIPTHLFASCIFLEKGDFENGWREYEWRKHAEEHPNRHKKNHLWNGSSLEGKTIVLHAEQGFGDTFQFIRYAQLVKNLGPKKLILEVQSALKKIASLLPYIDEVISDRDSVPQYDVQAPLMSLPFIMKTTLATIPNTIPYLHADKQLTTLWRNKLTTNRSFKIGICWKVEASHDYIQYHNKNVTLKVFSPLRAIPLNMFESLAAIPGVTLYSLLKEIPQEDRALAASLRIQKFGSDFDKSHGAFMDTAAIMKNLDLVISADTSIAHLAGGLGVPVWIVLPHMAEWRWMKNRNDSPWYPTARLFRQKKIGDWQEVMQEVSAELKTIARR